MPTLDRLNAIFREVFDDDSLAIQGHMTANDIDGWDSFAHVNLLTAIEVAFAISLDDAEVMRLKNVADILALIDRKLVPQQ